MDNLNVAYKELVDVAKGMVKAVTSEIDELITYLLENVETLSNDEIMKYEIKLSCMSYSFSEIKEKSQFKAALAESLRKDEYAKYFRSIDGSVAIRESEATLQTSGEIVTELLYDLTAGMLKSKHDEIHRVVDTLKSVLMTRVAEAKLSASVRDTFSE